VKVSGSLRFPRPESLSAPQQHGLPAVQLFVERAVATLDNRLTDAMPLAAGCAVDSTAFHGDRTRCGA
jgi:hypothetical protein